MTDKIVIFSTCRTEGDARRIATHLVDQRLAACVNILHGATSVYRWKGAVRFGVECLLIIKSRRDLLGKIEHEFASIHPYEVPELIAIPIVDGSRAYLDWLGIELPDGAQ